MVFLIIGISVLSLSACPLIFPKPTNSPGPEASAQPSAPPPPPLAANPQWQALPIRSKAEYDRGDPGGESYQIMHRMVRSYQHPERVYALQDVAGVWRSDDGGSHWRKPQTKGLYVAYGQSMEVDPVNPDKVLVIGYYPWNQTLDQKAGIYRSGDGAESFELILAYDDPDGEYGADQDDSRIGFNWDRHRFNNVNLVYDPNSTAGMTREATVWYAAFHGAELLRSENGGQSWNVVCSLAEFENIYQLAVQPGDPNTLYLCSSEGLYKSVDRGASFSAVGDLPQAALPANTIYYKSKVVTSLAFNPADSQDIMVTLSALVYQNVGNRPYLAGTGLFQSKNGGANFSQVQLSADNFLGTFTSGKVADFNSARYIYRHPVDADTIVLSGGAQAMVSHDGGAHWFRPPPAVPAPGLARDNSSGRLGMGNAIVALNPQDKRDFLFHCSATFWRSRDGGQSIAESAAGFTGMAWGFGRSVVAYDRFNPQRLAFFNCDVGMKISQTGGAWFEDYGNAVTSLGGNTYVSSFGQGINAGAFEPVAGSQVILAAAGQYRDNILARSTDNGRSWSVVNATRANYYFIAYHPTKPQQVYTHNLRSFDGGTSWEAIPFPSAYVTVSGGVTVTPVLVGMCEADPRVLYAVADYNRKILRSTDGGDNWSLYYNFGLKISNPDGTVVFACDPLDPKRIYGLITAEGADYGNILSYDGSNARVLDVMGRIPGNLAGNHVSAIVADPLRAGTLYAATHFPGLACVFKSSDYGASWTDITGSLPMVGMISSNLSVNPANGVLLRGGPYGTWEYR